MNRRNFLGSVIGLWASNSFLAKLITEPAQIFQPSHPEYEMCFTDLISGLELRAPGIKDIDSRLGRWSFIAYPLKCTKNLILNSVVLYKNGERIQESKFYQSIPMVNGDQLNCTQTLTVDGANTNDFDKAWEMYKFDVKARVFH